MQKEYFGIGSLKNLENILKVENPKKIFLVTGRDSYSISGLKSKLEPILENYSYVRFSDFSTNPKLEDIHKGMDLYKSEKCDLIIAAGGGSVIDIAKTITLLSHQLYTPKSYILKENKIKTESKPLVAIPTTSGTGSEATNFAVIYIDKTKHSLQNNSLLPKYTIIDPSLTFNLPKRTTAITGMDALSQAVESYWSIKSTEESKTYSKESIELILNNLKNAVNNPTEKSRISMARAANLSGKAINIAKTTACHATSYPMTSYFNIPHGHAASLLLGQVFIYNSNITDYDCNDSRGVEYVKRINTELMNTFNVTSPETFNTHIQNLLKEIKLEQNLAQVGIHEKDLDIIVENGFNQRINNNPRKITKTSLYSILKIS